MWLNIIGLIIILVIVVFTIRGIIRDKNSSNSKPIQNSKEKSNSEIKKEIEDVKRKQRPPEM